MAAALTALMTLTLLGPGALAPADAGVLEGAQARRLAGCCERNLSRPAGPGVVLVATEDCRFVGWDGLLLVPNVGAYRARVVDCQRRHELPRLRDVGILADVNVTALGHRQATLLLWRECHGDHVPDRSDK